jgi:lysophospholipase L1-like esterase
LRFGRDVSSGAARAQKVNMYHLLLAPGAAEVHEVWSQVLREIEEIQAVCRSRGARMLLVVFPCSVQIERPELDAPQKLLARFAESRSLAYLDLLPVMLEPFVKGELDLDGLFFDALHPTAQANRILAGRIVGEITSFGLLSSR